MGFVQFQETGNGIKAEAGRRPAALKKGVYMPIYGFDETKSKFPVLDKATYDPANKSGQIAVINDIKPVVLTDDATVNPLIPTLYVMNAASKTITLGTNVNAGIEITIFAKIATTVSYIVNGVTVTNSLSADNVISYLFTGSYWKIKTNKAGATKQASLYTTNFTPSSIGGVWYKVVNGICFVLINQVTPNYLNADLILAQNLPKCALYSSYPVWGSDIANKGYAYIPEGTTTIYCNPGVQTMLWCSFSYPVADDWVES